jgi:predicted DsbA family dithiol-disulfide isomerase
MINVWESVDAITEARNFAAIWGLEGTVLMDETGEYAAQLGIRGVPCNVIVDARGQVCAVGATTPDELNDAVASLLAEG